MSAPVAEGLEAARAEVVVARVAADHGRVALACSFQKEESVLLDIITRVAPGIRVFALDTGVLHDETYATWRAFEERFGIEIEARRGISLAEQAGRHGAELWARDPDACCAIRKVAPLRDALAGLDAWITGVRRDQSPTRAQAPKLGWDEAHGLWKASPLADWDERRVWTRIHERGLPYHALHDAGYASIGCVPCTRPGSGREGRWSGAAKTECGLHRPAGG